MIDYTREPVEPPDQAAADATHSHPKGCKPSCNEVVVSTMRYGSSG